MGRVELQCTKNLRYAGNLKIIGALNQAGRRP